MTLLALLTLLLSLRVNLGQLLAHLDFLKMHKLPLMAVFDSSRSFFSVYKGVKVTSIGLISDTETFIEQVPKIVRRILCDQNGPAIKCVVHPK